MATAAVSPLPLPEATPESVGIDPGRLDRLEELIETHIAAGRYPGAQSEARSRPDLWQIGN
jgi:hypothetical protein